MSAEGGWWRRTAATAHAFGRSIRGRIVLAYLAFAVIMATLGLYAAISIIAAGDLVDKTYDRSLLSINYARAAEADFASMQATAMRRHAAADEPERRRLDERLAALVVTLHDDLARATERSSSLRANREAKAVRDAVARWVEAQRAPGGSGDAQAAWSTLDRYAAHVERHLDGLIEDRVGHGFAYRQDARAIVTRELWRGVVATLAALILSGALAWLLMRRIVKPVSDAAMVAQRIASGELSVAVPRGDGDELGALLGSMSVMRGSIQTMIEREAAQRRSAQALLADAVQGLSEGVVVVDAAGRIILANARAGDLLGQPATAPTPTPRTLAEVEGSPVAKVLLAMPDGGGSASAETHLPDGRWLRVSRSPTGNGGFLAVCHDVSLLKAQKARLKEINLRLDTALSNMSQGLCLYDPEDRLLVFNRRFCDIFGIDPEALCPGMGFDEVAAAAARSGRYDQAHAILSEQAAIRAAEGHGSLCRSIHPGCIVSVEQQRTEDGGWIATYEDVTERYEAEARIMTMARRDALTGLANRTVFAERLEEAVGYLERGAHFATFCLDLDRFKEVNDTLGHPVGDGLLRKVAHRLQRCLREGDLVARLGGDEFAIIQLGIRTREDAVGLARRIVEALDRPFVIDGHTVCVGVSIGICMAPEHGSVPDILLRNADMALYRAKAAEGEAWCFFEVEMDLARKNRRALEMDLRRAVAEGEFELLYQPIFSITGHRITACEALLRWRQPQRGLISPATFVPLAEEIGIIGRIGQWVLHQACAEAARWPREVAVAVNVSANQFKDAALVQTVMAALAASRLPPSRLELEITETVLLTNSVSTLSTLHALKRLGVRIAMDDFGTGYSSLSYLQSFPFDKIKIDQSFVRDMDRTANAGLIVRSVINLGRSLGMSTTAEGVETAAQLERLRQEGCDEAQGYLFSKPVAADDVGILCAGTFSAASHPKVA